MTETPRNDSSLSSRIIRRGLRGGGWRLIAIAVVLLAAWFAQQFLLLAFLGLLFGNVVSAGVDWLRQHHIPRVPGVVIIILSFFAGIAGIGYWIAPQVINESQQVVTQLPQAIDRMQQWTQSEISRIRDAVGQSGPGGASVFGDSQLPSAGTLVQQYLYPAARTVLDTVIGFFIVLFVTIYFAAQPRLYKYGFLHLISHQRRDRVHETIDAVAYTLRRWMGAQLISMTIIGVVTTLGLWALGVKTALALGVMAGILEFIPFFGPIISFFPAGAIAFLQSPQLALWVLLLYIGIQQLESHLITPLVMESQVEVPPILTILVGTIFGSFFGFLGLLTAVPLTATTIVVVKMLYVEDVIGDDVEVSEGAS